MAVAVNWIGDVEPAVVVDVDGDTVTVCTGPGLTVTVAVPYTEPSVAVTVTGPAVVPGVYIPADVMLPPPVLTDHCMLSPDITLLN